MANIGVCIEPFFSDLPYGERLAKVHELGFKHYEFWFHNMRFDGSSLIPEDKDFGQLAELNDRYGLTCTDFVFNHPDGGIVAAMIDKKDRNLIVDSLGGMIELAKKINCRAFISGATAWQQKNAPFMFTAISRSHCPSSNYSKGSTS